MPLPERYAHALKELERGHRLRARQEIQRLPGGYVMKDGRRLLSFSDNDYLGLSFHPTLQQAAANALAEYGTGAGASRLISGNHPLYTQLERKLAAFKGTEDALLFGSGYLTNTGVIPALAGKGDLILSDKLIHASLIDGIKLSGATHKRFRHNDAEHLGALLRQHRAKYRHCLIVSEGVFSMDGDRAPLSRILPLAAEQDCLILLDDAHGFGVVSPRPLPLGEVEISAGNFGRGSGSKYLKPSPVSAKGLADLSQWERYADRLLQIGTFSKAAGSYGGYVCGSAEWMEYLLNHSRSVIYTTGLPPATVAANLAALEVMEREPERAEKALANARLFCELLGLPAPQSAIVPLIIGEAADALQASLALEQAGFLVSAIRPPTVPQGTARLRFAFSAVHVKEDVERLAGLLKTRNDCHPELVSGSINKPGVNKKMDAETSSA